MIPESHRDLLDKKGFAHVATIGSDGSHLRFSLTETRQKLHNLKRNPRVAISITDPDDPYRYIEIRGTVATIDDDPSTIRWRRSTWTRTRTRSISPATSGWW